MTHGCPKRNGAFIPPIQPLYLTANTSDLPSMRIESTDENPTVQGYFCWILLLSLSVTPFPHFTYVVMPSAAGRHDHRRSFNQNTLDVWRTFHYALVNSADMVWTRTLQPSLVIPDLCGLCDRVCPFQAQKGEQAALCIRLLPPSCPTKNQVHHGAE